jgi:hypothetical protein
MKMWRNNEIMTINNDIVAIMKNNQWRNINIINNENNNNVAIIIIIVMKIIMKS